MATGRRRTTVLRTLTCSWYPTYRTIIVNAVHENEYTSWGYKDETQSDTFVNTNVIVAFYLFEVWPSIILYLIQWILLAPYIIISYTVTLNN